MITVCCHIDFYSAKVLLTWANGKGRALRVFTKQFSVAHFSNVKILLVKILTVALAHGVLPKKLFMAHRKISIHSHTCCVCNRELTHSEIAGQQDQNVDFNSYACDDCRYTQVNEHYLPDTFSYTDAGQIRFTVKRRAA